MIETQTVGPKRREIVFIVAFAILVGVAVVTVLLPSLQEDPERDETQHNSASTQAPAATPPAAPNPPTTR